MKNLLFILTSLILFSCGNKSSKKNHSIIGMEFKKFNEIERISNYLKVSDTSFFWNKFYPEYGILHLQDKLNNLVIFKSITHDSIDNITFKVLDTLTIPILKKPEYISIGYCDIDYGIKENFIAIVEKTDSLKIQNIKKIWKANSNSEKIERVNNLRKYGCYNELYIDN